jgi:hypothetical protein
MAHLAQSLHAKALHHSTGDTLGLMIQPFQQVLTCECRWCLLFLLSQLDRFKLHWTIRHLAQQAAGRRVRQERRALAQGMAVRLMKQRVVHRFVQHTIARYCVLENANNFLDFADFCFWIYFFLNGKQSATASTCDES